MSHTEEELQAHLAVAASHKANPGKWAREMLTATGRPIPGYSRDVATGAYLQSLVARIAALEAALKAKP